MILLTTSRRPTKRIRTFCNDLARAIPNVVRVNRGKMSLQELAENTFERGLDRVIIVDRWKGGPGRIRFHRMERGRLVEVPPEINVKGMKLQRELKGAGKKIDSLIIGKQADGSPSDMVMLSDALSDFLEIGIVDIEEAGSNYEAAIKVYRDDAQLTHLSFFLLPSMVEVGPRITIVFEFLN